MRPRGRIIGTSSPRLHVSGDFSGLITSHGLTSHGGVLYCVDDTGNGVGLHRYLSPQGFLHGGGGELYPERMKYIPNVVVTAHGGVQYCRCGMVCWALDREEDLHTQVYPR